MTPRQWEERVARIDEAIARGERCPDCTLHREVMAGMSEEDLYCECEEDNDA